jgi:hypothetical protein
MSVLSAVMKDEIAGVLEGTTFKQRGFSVDHGSDASVTITRFKYRFTIGSTETGFMTTEFPGVASEKTETFDRSDFASCLRAIRDWVDRIVDREESFILDEFGGVADRDPSLPMK